MLASVYIVSKKKIVLLRWVAPVVEYLEQVLKLPVDVSDNFDGRPQLEQHGLGNEDLPSHLADGSNLCLGHFDVVAFLFVGEAVDKIVDFSRGGAIIHIFFMSSLSKRKSV